MILVLDDGWKELNCKINMEVVGNKTLRSQSNFKSSYIKRKDQKKQIEARSSNIKVSNNATLRAKMKKSKNQE